MERTTLDMWVGAFVVGGIIALTVLAFKVGNLGSYDGSEAYTVYGEFDNIGGLKIKAPVKSAGVVVGRVADIHFDNGKFRARVAMRISKQFQFPKDTSASILTSGLLGEQYIGLEAGGDDVNLKNGDKFQLTQSAMVLEQLIGQFLFSKASEDGNKKKADGGDKKAAAAQ
ncbi:MAG TPA: outer membrane lipid asymmetry maintenance protein MlaD [Sulfuricella sp.]|nr:outer membrane lipid asymmetry maintenance protein MlaD [Sulfuricella sp.]